MEEKSLNIFKQRAMIKEGYPVDPSRPDDVKYAVAQKRNIPLKRGYNGQLTAEQAGKIGGPIGGAMVREMIRAAQEQLAQTPQQE
jgi:hypothetical protein